MSKKCPVCDHTIIGRADKKFCSIECRVEHNNKLYRDRNNYMRNVNNIIRKNRRILKELNPDGRTKISDKILREKGYKFNYMTSIYTTKAGKTYHFCYEQGILSLGNGIYTLVQKEKYVE